MIGVITDHDARTSEVIDSDHLSIAVFVLNQMSEILQISFVWGGFDSNGAWHVDHKREAATISISGKRPEEAALFHDLAFDETGGFRHSFDEAFFKKILFERGLFDIANDRIFGLDDVTVFCDDEPVFVKEKPKQEGTQDAAS